MRVAVVGAGIMGSCAARELAERGHQVTLYEQFELAHTRGSSHGRSRIVRKAYPDAFYTAIMDEGYPLWRELQLLSHEQLLFEPGLLYFGSFDSENLRDVLRGLQQLEVPHEVLDHEQMRKVFPALKPDAGQIGIFTPEAGWVHAERALITSWERFRDLGGTVIENAKIDSEALAARYDARIVASGPWVANSIDLPVRVTVQTFGYAGVPAPVEGPAWIEDGPEFFYGFPSEPGASSIKIGVHQAGPTFDPNLSERPDATEHRLGIVREAARRFGIQQPLVEYHTCLYTSTVDEDFLFGRLGEDGYFVSACSGHGFKFGPWMGRKLADFVEEKDAPENHPRFCWPRVKLEA